MDKSFCLKYGDLFEFSVENESKIPPDQSTLGFINDTKCNVSLCNISNVNNTFPTKEITASKETCLERSLGYVVIGIMIMIKTSCGQNAIF